MELRDIPISERFAIYEKETPRMVRTALLAEYCIALYESGELKKEDEGLDIEKFIKLVIEDLKIINGEDV